MRAALLLIIALLVPALAGGATVGVNVHLPTSDTMDLADELGAGWVRIDFNWFNAEPTEGTYDWTVFDGVIDAAHARGLKVFASVGYCPQWASISGNRDGAGFDNDVPNGTKYQRFVRDASARYAPTTGDPDGRVQAWGPWNEPNLGGFFEGTKQEWIDQVFIPGVDGIKQGCPSCLIVGPELATIGSIYAEYLLAALAARGPDLDVISWHIYHDFPEDSPGAGVTSDSFYNKLDSHRIVKVGGITVYEGPLSVREILLQQGYASLPVWVTETGWEAVAGDPAAEEAQRLYVQRVMDAMDARPWWTNTFFYELVEEHPGGLWPDIHWGLALRTHDFDATYADNYDRKAAFDYLKARLALPPPTDGGLADGGVLDGPGGDGGLAGDAAPPVGDGGATADAAHPGGDGATGDAAPPAADAGPGGGGSGCGCRAAGRAPGALGLGLGLAALALGFRRQRR
jgi:hypothetical protein